MKKTLSIFLALLMLTASLGGTLSVQAATPNAPTFSTEEGAYTDSVTIVLRSGSLLNTVYYEIYEYGSCNQHGKLKQEQTKYTLPFTITESCYITAWSERGDEMSETVTNRYFIRYSSDEGRFTVDEEGVLREYTGNSPHLVIPEQVDGIPVTAIGSSVFSQRLLDSYTAGTYKNNTDIYSNFLLSVTLPDTCTEIEYAAFQSCINLTHVYGKNLKNIGDYAFAHCTALESVELTSTEKIGRYAFYLDEALTNIESDAVTTVRANALTGCNSLQRVILPNLETLEDGQINCQYMHIGKLEELRAGDQYHIGNRISTKTLVAPYLKALGNITGIHYADSVFAPKLAGALGGSIRLSDSGLRFGFIWDNSTEFEAAYGANGDDMEYGFVYAYKRTDDLTVENGKTRVAQKRVNKDGKTSFNLVFTDIPKANYTTEISARAYVRIDGVYFYSDILTRSFEGVAQAVLSDPSVDESIKTQLQEMLET